MNYSLVQKTAPSVEPVSVAELKLQIHITHTIQDTTLSAYIVAARLQAEEFLRQSLITQVWELSLDCLPPGEIKLLRGPIQELTSVKVYDEDGVETVMDNSDFDLDTTTSPGRLSLRSDASWPSITPRRYGTVKIRYKAGFGDTSATVPANIRHAIMLFAGFADDNRAADTAEYPTAFWDLLRPSRVHYYEPL